jgi:hypothetical protein
MESRRERGTGGREQRIADRFGQRLGGHHGDAEVVACGVGGALGHPGRHAGRHRSAVDRRDDAAEHGDIDQLTRLRNNLADCIGCGCLSLDRCLRRNRDDRLGEQGSGPRRLLTRAIREEEDRIRSTGRRAQPANPLRTGDGPPPPENGGVATVMGDR